MVELYEVTDYLDEVMIKIFDNTLEEVYRPLLDLDVIYGVPKDLVVLAETSREFECKTVGTLIPVAVNTQITENRKEVVVYEMEPSVEAAWKAIKYCSSARGFRVTRHFESAGGHNDFTYRKKLSKAFYTFEQDGRVFPMEGKTSDAVRDRKASNFVRQRARIVNSRMTVYFDTEIEAKVMYKRIR